MTATDQTVHTPVIPQRRKDADLQGCPNPGGPTTEVAAMRRAAWLHGHVCQRCRGSTCGAYLGMGTAQKGH